LSAGGGSALPDPVDEKLLAEDLSRTARAATAAIESVMSEVRRDGVPYEWLRRCEEEGRDGTRLGGCVKFYLPRPAGRWGAVLAGDEEATKPALVLVAVGERHPAQRWKPSVYEIAHRRLNR
jgi:hypothetical protein